MLKVRIGIDPDINLNGFCIIHHEPFTQQKIAALGNKDFFDTITAIKENYNQHGQNLTVHLEAAWLIQKSNWHTSYKDKFGKVHEMNSLVREKAAKNVGENHAVGKLLELYLKKHNIPYKLYKPNPGRDSKWDANWFNKITNFNAKSNQEQRDAVRAAWL